MSDGRRNENDPLDENVTRLLSRTPPERALPREAKQRILSVLTGQAAPASGARDETTRGVARSRKMRSSCVNRGKSGDIRGTMTSILKSINSIERARSTPISPTLEVTMPKAAGHRMES